MVFNSERGVDVRINPIQSPQLTLTPALSESPHVSVEPTETLLPITKKECLVTGCSGQICSDEKVTTTCEFKEEYACYRTAKCEQQEDGKCGWTPTEELVACLVSAWEKEGLGAQ